MRDWHDEDGIHGSSERIEARKEAHSVQSRRVNELTGSLAEQT